MYLKQLKITNYKSFFETTELNFEPGFNVLLGANSSGKTTVLEALECHNLQNFPHRSLLNIKEIGDLSTALAETNVRFEMRFDEIKKIFASTPDFWLPIGAEDGSTFYSQDKESVKEAFKNKALNLDLKLNYQAGQSMRLGIAEWPTPWLPVGGSSNYAGGKYSFVNDCFENIAHVGQGTTLQQTLWNATTSKIYRFSSERIIPARYGSHPSAELLPNSENLAYCINHFQSSQPNLFNKLNHLLHRVFPTVFWAGAVSDGSGHFVLKVHSTPPSLDRGDLAVPINNVGTGVGHALAILYVALTAQTQRFILLEEPNSFLHPRALRELLAILVEIGGKHQFFITTHSSDVLRTVNASTVTLLEYDGQQTTAKQTSGKELHTLQAGMLDLGIRLTDLHGCDKVLWVEGQTEEAIFPILLRHFYPEQAQGIAVLPLHSTGDFESKKFAPKKVAEIYKQLSTASFLAPPMVGIALDRERKKPEDIERIEKECGGLVRFLEKPMLEDYLLNAAAITQVLNQEPDTSTTQDQIEAGLQAVLARDDCKLNPQNKNSNELHAANVLSFLFSDLSKSEYHKTSHGPKLAEWILLNQPNEFEELKNWLGKFLKKPETTLPVQ